MPHKVQLAQFISQVTYLSDEFFGNLYHLNAEEEPEQYDYPHKDQFPRLYELALPRGVLKCKATGEVSTEPDDPKFGPVGKQTIEDTGPLTAKRMETIDDDFADATVDYIKRQHDAGNPFFVWCNFTGHQGWLVPVRRQLLPALPTRCPSAAARRYRHEPHRLSLRQTLTAKRCSGSEGSREWARWNTISRQDGLVNFTGKQAIVTGAGSGIGAALCRALAGVGAEVVCTDIDGEAAERTAAGLGEKARCARLDVTDSAAVQSAVDEVVNRAGRLDLMFNNAGIAWGGDTELLTLDQWNAIIDVNIRGVVHGVAAAYPVMVAQGHGQIVNTASMAGLTAAGQITSYVTTKHAVVGLSLALRSEAAARGVGVLAVCPAAVETPILDKGAVGGFLGRDYYVRGQGVKTPYDADRLARDTLHAIARNKALLVKPRLAHAQWVFARMAPGLMQRAAVRFVAKQRAMQAAARTTAR